MAGERFDGKDSTLYTHYALLGLIEKPYKIINLKQNAYLALCLQPNSHQ